MSRFIRQARESVELPEIDISDPEQVQNRINWYLDRCESNGLKPTILGLCNVLGIDRKTLYRWSAGIDRASTHQKMIVRYKNLLEELWEMEMLEGKINPVVGIFIGKNHFGYVDKQDSLAITNGDLIPKFEELSLANKIDESNLVEIKDSKLIQRFVDHIPNASLALNSLNNAKQYIQKR